MATATSFAMPQSATARGQLIYALVPIATHLIHAQLDAFAGRLSNALLALSENSSDPREANLTFNSGQLLKKNTYAFYYTASKAFENCLKQEVDHLINGARPSRDLNDTELSLVSYEEMDKKLAFSKAARNLEIESAEQFTALNMRLANLVDVEALSITQNPFRPEAFLKILFQSWCEFSPEKDTHEIVLPLLTADILFDLEPILLALNKALIAKGILPDLQDSYRIKRSAQQQRRTEAGDAEGGQLHQRLRQYFSGGADGGAAAGSGSFASSADGGAAAGMPFQGGYPAHGDGAGAAGGYYPSGAEAVAAITQGQFFQNLAQLQKNLQLQQLINSSGEILRLSQMREQMPELATTGNEKHTLDLLSQVFDSVFRNPSIPAPVKELISVLQIPVLKAALLDQEFFFQDHHPARRLIDLLSHHGLAVDQSKGQADPLYQTMQKNVEKVQQEYDKEVAVFEEVVNNLEQQIKQDEAATEEAIQAPIKTALRKERIKQANADATQQVEMRVGSGEVVAFVETFLENRWVKVLTLAYSIKDEKPHALEDAIKTMDDLIWSVQPKITLQQRQDLLGRLPAILARLNKWLSLIKWNDDDRARFFAELAECHASIVRAPLDLSPERQLEIAVEVAQKAAERRLAKRAEAEKVAEEKAQPDEHTHTAAMLERGTWLEYIQPDGLIEKFRLAWVSPMRSLYIFTTNQKDRSFSITAEDLETAFRQDRAQILMLDNVVDRALSEALQNQEQETDPELEVM